MAAWSTSMAGWSESRAGWGDLLRLGKLPSAGEPPQRWRTSPTLEHLLMLESCAACLEPDPIAIAHPSATGASERWTIDVDPALYCHRSPLGDGRLGRLGRVRRLGRLGRLSAPADGLLDGEFVTSPIAQATPQDRGRRQRARPASPPGACPGEGDRQQKFFDLKAVAHGRQAEQWRSPRWPALSVLAARSRRPAGPACS